MNQFIRNIQIDLIMDNHNPIIDTFNSIWNDLSVIETDVYHQDGGEFIYYNSNKEWIFLRDDKHERFWCHYRRYWELFESNLTYQDIRDLTKELVENALNNSISTTKVTYYKVKEDVEIALTNIKNPINTEYLSQEDDKISSKMLCISNPLSSKKFEPIEVFNALNNI